MAPQRVLIYLLRRDLRLADNPIFYEINQLSKVSHKGFTHVLPVYIFAAQQVEISGFLADNRLKSPYPEARSEVGKFWRCGPHRAKFLAESVWDLKLALESAGNGLLIRVGMLGHAVQELLDEFKQYKDEAFVSALWMTGEEGVEEKREERDVRQVAEGAGIEFKLWMDEKYFVDDRDLPFKDPQELPDVFTTYRKSVEPLRDAPRRVLPTPTTLPPLPKISSRHPEPFVAPDSYHELESALLKPLIASPTIGDPPSFPPGVKSAHPFHGGSSTGQRRLQHLLRSGAMTKYKDTRNGLLGLDFSTKLSAWLSLGCITARQIHAHLVEFEEGRSDQYRSAEGYGKGENQGTAAVRFELLWRDYMRLCTRKFGPRLFRIEGFRNDSSYPWKTPGAEGAGPEVARVLERFLKGTTGTGLIDASQRELLLTGYTSNRARQNVASYLTKHLGINWKLGAEWYETMLVDYDLSSNWGNWQYVAGVGNDPRGEARVFNPIKQAFDYDSQGEYVKSWIPELRSLEDPQEIFQAWKIDHKRRMEMKLAGLEMVEHPLKKIDFKVGSKNKSGGGGRYGGSSRYRSANGAGDGGKGQNGAHFGARGSYHVRGRGDKHRSQGRPDGLDKAGSQGTVFGSSVHV